MANPSPANGPSTTETNLDLVAETTRLRENKEPVASSARHAQIAAAKGPATTTPENKLKTLERNGADLV